MQPPPRTTRSKASPGLIDRPSSRRPSAVVVQEKTKKKEAATLKAAELHRRTEQVKEVEREGKRAQAEVVAARQRGRDKIVKKTFPRPDENTNATTANQSKRDADSADLSEPTIVAKVTKATKSSSPRSSKGISPNKPSGLTGPAKSTIMPPTATTVDEGDGSSTSTEDEEVIDDLEFSTSSENSLVSISSTTGVSTTSSKSSTPRPGVRSLPPNVQRSFSDHFTPCIITEMGCSTTPWSKLDVDTVQGHVNIVYAGHDYAVKNGDGFHTSTNSRIMSFRNTIGTTALANTQSYLGRYTRDETEEYIRSALIYYGEIPFLYRVFDPTNVRSVKEKGGYKVVRHGIFQHQAIIDTMLVYYGKQGTKACIPTASIPGENPIGVLALVCTAIERALSMHTEGYFIKTGHSFSDKSWGHRTAIYLKLAKDMTASQWGSFYRMLRVHEDIQDKFEEFAKPAKQYTNDPDEYFIAESDPEEG